MKRKWEHKENPSQPFNSLFFFFGLASLGSDFLVDLQGGLLALRGEDLLSGAFLFGEAGLPHGVFFAHGDRFEEVAEEQAEG